MRARARERDSEGEGERERKRWEEKEGYVGRERWSRALLPRAGHVYLLGSAWHVHLHRYTKRDTCVHLDVDLNPKP